MPDRPEANASKFKTNDWMLDRIRFKELEKLYGPFDLDACADNLGRNSQLKHYCCPNDSFLEKDVSGQSIYMNPPYDNVYAFLRHYMDCKEKKPETTRGLFVLPAWEGAAWYKEFATKFKRVNRFHRGTQLFSRPSKKEPGKRVRTGPIRWPVDIFIDEPECAKIAPLINMSKACDEPLLVIRARMDCKDLSFMVDSGATRNFLGEHVRIKGENCNPIRVKLANGEVIRSEKPSG